MIEELNETAIMEITEVGFLGIDKEEKPISAMERCS